MSACMFDLLWLSAARMAARTFWPLAMATLFVNRVGWSQPDAASVKAARKTAPKVSVDFADHISQLTFALTGAGPATCDMETERCPGVQCRAGLCGTGSELAPGALVFEMIANDFIWTACEQQQLAWFGGQHTSSGTRNFCVAVGAQGSYLPNRPFRQRLQ